MKLSEFDYDLPDEFIAQTPVEPRDSSRLLCLNRQTGDITHRRFSDMIDLIDSGDVLVLNNTRVIPARLIAKKATAGGKAEILLLKRMDSRRWQALVGGRGIKRGSQLIITEDIRAEIVEELQDAERVIEFSKPIDDRLNDIGTVPLPPYIHTPLTDSERYQTIYSQKEGSSAAPTAGLHFTPELLIRLREKGVQFAYCTLHIGLGTFQPVKTDDIRQHAMHSERATLLERDAHTINQAKLAGGRIIAVGTTAARTLETAGILSEGGDPSAPSLSQDACPWRPVIAFDRETNLFIYPGYRWRVVDAIVTNFHLPKSTLLMMISSFAGRERVLNAYEAAKREGYRFFSFGDAMFIA